MKNKELDLFLKKGTRKMIEHGLNIASHNPAVLIPLLLNTCSVGLQSSLAQFAFAHGVETANGLRDTVVKAVEALGEMIQEQDLEWDVREVKDALASLGGSELFDSILNSQKEEEE